ncbi:hypothetical protein BDP27DRAFT_1418513 [Rhodocollybia butyracea]|uniref:Uncharacterized protein n=1 Tax=Rhodocollybia butyracea TaxID=206335 RepID=A0A9P5Q0N2_9AGAR|nr:hypothetical protein BDP27DRAFT_1418513 [Rhodocollybia butyracea]
MAKRPHGSFFPPKSTTAMLYLSFIQTVLAQAPVNDVISWPSGLLLLASVLYAALGTSVDRLWEIEPSSGIFIFSGLPQISIPLMQRVTWAASACHFISGVKSANGISNFWIEAGKVSVGARAEALEKAMKVLRCVGWETREGAPHERVLDPRVWTLTTEGLLCPAKPSAMKTTDTGTTAKPPAKPAPPVARDFLLFAAAEYHVFQHWVVDVRRKGVTVFSTRGLPFSSVIDVASEDDAIPVVAAQMVRRPLGQSPLRSKAQKIVDSEQDTEHYSLDLQQVDLDTPICLIDFHSYAPKRSKVAASLRELAHSYFLVVQHIKQTSPHHDCPTTGAIARIDVGQTMWISFLGGSVLDHGRITFQNLPGGWGNWQVSADHAYLTRVEAVLEQLEPIANTPAFDSGIYGGGISRRTAVPFLLVGAIGQMLICYFLSVGTSAGVWTSVVLANSLFAGKLNDWHSAYYGKSTGSEEPGLKMRVPGSHYASKAEADVMCVVTLDRSAPKQGGLRPGFFLNVLGLIAAVFGAIFQSQTRDALGFSPRAETANWVVYTSIALTLGTSGVILLMVVLQNLAEKTWMDDAMMPTRVMTYCTLTASFGVSGLAIFFRIKGVPQFWPILDALTWMSGFPLGMIENGRLFSVDDNVLHLVLLNRWMMGAVASAVGSSSFGR